MNGKGSKRRPTNDKDYKLNFDRIFEKDVCFDNLSDEELTAYMLQLSEGREQEISEDD